MAANTNPIFPKQGDAGVFNVLLTAAMTNTKAFDGTEATGAGKLEKIFQADTTNGSRLDTIYVRLTSTNGATASGTTAATVVRFWLNNGGANTTAANNQLLPFELAIPATAVTALATSTLTYYALPVNKVIPAGYAVYAGLTVAIGGTNCAVTFSFDAGDF
jgi:hypothetical protein